MTSRTSSSAGRADAETQMVSYRVRVAGMVKFLCPVITRHAYGGVGEVMGCAGKAKTDDPAGPGACRNRYE